MNAKQFLLLIFISIHAIAFGQVDPVDKNGLAIGGYDLVSYFNSLKPSKGKPEFKTVRDGVTYYFINAENQKNFEATPEKYLPQYDGYCALAIGTQSKKVSIDPMTYKITEGKLYLFFNGQLAFSGTKFNSLEPWMKDEVGLIKKSDQNWPKVKTKKYR
jgi:YHS domain-containing protein